MILTLKKPLFLQIWTITKFFLFFFSRENLFPFVNLEPFLEPVTSTNLIRSTYNNHEQNLAGMLYPNDEKLRNLTNTILLKQKPEIRAENFFEIDY